MNRHSFAADAGLPHFIGIDVALEYARGLLRKRVREFRNIGLSDPVDWLNLSTLSGVLGLTCETIPTLPFADGRVALGLLDIPERSILVSEERGLEVARFTWAHELGHYLYHQDRVKRHWERGLDPAEKNPQEREANQFASRLLMPKKLLTLRLSMYFSKPPIRVNENWLYFLLGDQTDPDPKRLDLEYALATANKSSGSEPIEPLHQQFKVSKMAMAIRLLEIGALVYPATSYRTDL